MHNGLQRGLAFFLCAGLTISSLAGCSKKEEETGTDWTVTAMTLGDDTVSAGEMNFMLRYLEAQNDQWVQMFYQMGYGNMWTSGNGDGLKESVTGQLHNMLQAKQHMEEYGVELTDEDKALISETADQFIADNDEETLEKMSATKENVESILTLYLIQSRMQTAMTADVDTEVSDEEAAQRTVRYVSFTPNTEPETEEETETLEEELSEAETEEAAEAITEAGVEAESEVKTQSSDEAESQPEEETTAEAQTEAVETEAETEDPALTAAKEIAYADAIGFLQSVQDVASAEDFAAAGTALRDADEVDSTISVSSYSFGADDTTPDAAIIAATNDLEDDTLVEEVIEADDVYYVLYVEYAFDREATDEKKEEIVEDRKSDRLEELYGEWETEDGFTTNSAALDLMVFDMFLLPPEEAETEGISEVEAETGEIIEEVETTAVEIETEAVTE